MDLNLRIRRKRPKAELGSFDARSSSLACKLRAKWQRKNWAVRIEVSAENLSFPFVHSDCRVNATPNLTRILALVTELSNCEQPVFTFRCTLGTMIGVFAALNENLFLLDKNAAIRTDLESHQ